MMGQIQLTWCAGSSQQGLLLAQQDLCPLLLLHVPTSPKFTLQGPKTPTCPPWTVHGWKESGDNSIWKAEKMVLIEWLYQFDTEFHATYLPSGLPNVLLIAVSNWVFSYHQKTISGAHSFFIFIHCSWQLFHRHKSLKIGMTNLWDSKWSWIPVHFGRSQHSWGSGMTGA